jgi:predicted site-specific integrase-resolvase
MDKPDEQANVQTIDGERLYDNQDLCLLFNICRRTLQRYRTQGWLPYKRIDQKAYYTESDVKKFIEERANRKKRTSIP